MNNPKKIHNFSAGPSILSDYALEQSVNDIKNFAGTGLSVLEISHRSKQFVQVVDEAQQLVKTLLGLNDDYEVLFLQGGASTQFFQVPMNFLKNKASYLNTGTWSKKAIKEAKAFGTIDVCGSSETSNFNYIPVDYSVATDSDYFHCTSNNTIFGTQMKSFPKSEIPMIYAGAQKNMGPAGVTLVVIHKEMYKRVADRHIPTMLQYGVHGENGSMYNTPPVFPILVSKYNMEWMLKEGGIAGMEKRNRLKADLLYQAIDKSEYFEGTAEIQSRSDMNACFVFKAEFEHLSDKFDEACKENGLSGLKGHRSVGGYRASLYNALPLESVQVLVNVIENFA
jgi:phosphoserine aminotransferase